MVEISTLLLKKVLLTNEPLVMKFKEGFGISNSGRSFLYHFVIATPYPKEKNSYFHRVLCSFKTFTLQTEQQYLKLKSSIIRERIIILSIETTTIHSNIMKLGPCQRRLLSSDVYLLQSQTEPVNHRAYNFPLKEKN